MGIPVFIYHYDENGTKNSTSNQAGYVSETGKKNGKQTTVQQDYDYNYLME